MGELSSNHIRLYSRDAGCKSTCILLHVLRDYEILLPEFADHNVITSLETQGPNKKLEWRGHGCSFKFALVLIIWSLGL